VILPVKGLRVVEIANEISGPYCGKLFVDIGADVTKIEGPGGDSLRRWGPFPGGEPDRSALVDAMGRPALLEDERFATVGHDSFDRAAAAWTTTQSPANIVAALQERDVHAEEVIKPEGMYDVPQLDARGYYEDYQRPITGGHRYPGWPFRITPGPARHHRFAAPTLGQHNDEILSGLGLSGDELVALRRDRVIGEKVADT
jgi:crotonobetainyl-CoA:carnitine CoA-transferase CaiB-like acyl-CoA transferase